MTRVALIDDHESVRLGLEAACARAQKVVVFSGSNVTGYVDWRAFSASPPADVVVLDLTLGDGAPIWVQITREEADHLELSPGSIVWARPAPQGAQAAVVAAG